MLKYGRAVPRGGDDDVCHLSSHRPTPSSRSACSRTTPSAVPPYTAAVASKREPPATLSGTATGRSQAGREHRHRVSPPPGGGARRERQQDRHLGYRMPVLSRSAVERIARYRTIEVERSLSSLKKRKKANGAKKRKIQLSADAVSVQASRKSPKSSKK